MLRKLKFCVAVSRSIIQILADQIFSMRDDQISFPLQQSMLIYKCHDITTTY